MTGQYLLPSQAPGSSDKEQVLSSTHCLLALRGRGWAGVQLQMFLCIPDCQSDPHFLSGSAALPLQLYKGLRSSENLIEWSIPDCTIGCPCTAHFSDFRMTFSHSSFSSFPHFLSVNCLQQHTWLAHIPVFLVPHFTVHWIVRWVMRKGDDIITTAFVGAVPGIL